MKNLFTTLIVLIGLSSFAQTAKPKATISTTQAQAGTTTALTPKAKALCKTWLLSKTENFGDLHNPSDAQKGDQIMLMESGQYRMVMEGVGQGGTWTLDNSNVWLILTKNDGTVIKLKIIESTDSTLKIDYRDADDVHNILYYSLTGK